MPKICHAFRVQNGQVILRENREYVIEDAREKEYSGPGARMGDSYIWKKWHVKARELSGGQYNPKGKMIEFDQEDKEPIDIVRKMDIKIDYK